MENWYVESSFGKYRQKNHVLERAKKISCQIFCLIWFLIPIFQNSTLVKSKNENHQNSICDGSKEPHWFTDHKSEEKLKKIEIWRNE